MTAKQWTTKINKALEALGQTDTAYKSVISTLADILEQRDSVYQEYVDGGCEYDW